MKAGDAAEAHILREIGLGKLGRRVGKTFITWKREVRDDYGEVDERRLYRVLEWLIAHGLARRSDERVPADEHDEPNTQPLYLYFAVMEGAKVPKRKACPRCGICGAFNLTARSHVFGVPHKRLTGEEKREKNNAAIRIARGYIRESIAASEGRLKVGPDGRLRATPRRFSRQDRRSIRR